MHNRNYSVATTTNIFQTLAGTVNQSFKIGGGNGLTVYQGNSAPFNQNIDANGGDLYVLIGNTPIIYQYNKLLDTWIPISTDQNFTRTKVLTEIFMATNELMYLGVNYPGATIFLPQGTPNKRFVIKDETGEAFTSPVLISPISPDTIDGQPYITLDTNYESVSLIYGDNGWFIF